MDIEVLTFRMHYIYDLLFSVIELFEEGKHEKEKDYITQLLELATKNQIEIIDKLIEVEKFFAKDYLRYYRKEETNEIKQKIKYHIQNLAKARDTYLKKYKLKKEGSL